MLNLLLLGVKFNPKDLFCVKRFTFCNSGYEHSVYNTVIVRWSRPLCVMIFMLTSDDGEHIRNYRVGAFRVIVAVERSPTVAGGKSFSSPFDISRIKIFNQSLIWP